MSTKKSPQSKSPAGGKGTRSSAASHASAAQRTLEEIQLAALSAKLRDLGASTALVQAFGEDPEKYASQLVSQFEALSVKLRKQPIVFRRDTRSIRLIETLDILADIFGPWITIVAPNATVGVVQAPSSSVSMGGLDAEIYTGDLALFGDVYSYTTQEQWWVNTWQYTIPLPQILSTDTNPGWLSYRFNVGAFLSFYRQDVLSGSVHVYVTTATTNDLATHPLDFNQPVSSEFLIDTALPVSDVPPLIDGEAAITGAIQLVPGGTPAIGIIIGLVVSAANGEVQIIPGEYSLIELTNPDAKVAADIGKIEYRRDRPFWVEAVAKMLAAEP